MVRKTRRKLKPFLFNGVDYNSGDGMLTSVWGPSLWHTLHTISFNYPTKPSQSEKNHYRNYILSLKYILPCKYCRINLRKNFKQLPLTMARMKSRETFSRYVYELHELINTMLGKKSGLTYDTVRERYEHFRSRCKPIQVVKKQTRKHKGCVTPLHKVKSKGIIQIVPYDTKCESIQVDDKCLSVQ
jgi:hypothetical protein|uniref:thiol oxidase n=1 Tax=viral metagenome TaxID=1070528 RepID=A0A6C0JAY3_9ZZZZ